jgi:phosphinothricin acetyltransferase
MAALRPGETYKEVTLKDGRKTILRAPDWHDLDNLVALVNELVEERAEILRTTKVTRDEEAEWLGRRLASIENGALQALVAEIDGKIVASSAVGQRIPEYSEHIHVGEMGISILKNARGIGLGTTLIESLIELAKRAGLMVIMLDMFATNTVARRLYEKVGFVEVGKIPKAINRDGKYIDLIQFAIEI